MVKHRAGIHNTPAPRRRADNADDYRTIRPHFMPLTFLDRLNRRFGRFAIQNLTLILIIGQFALYVANLFPQGVSLERVALDPAKVMQGEVWRLVTFLFSPPPIGPIFVFFYFSLFYLFGSTLENQWGEFRYNVFLLIGYLANVAAAFAASALMMQPGRMPGEAGTGFASVGATNAFLYLSVFLAFARLYPNFILNIFWVLPIRIKWLALITWIGFLISLNSGTWMTRLLVLATVLNYLLFFGREHWREIRFGHRRRSFQTKAKKAVAAPVHVCRVCGVSSNESPRMPFRYCTKCEGQCCYCPEHIRNHEHVTAEEPAAHEQDAPAGTDRIAD